MTARLSPVRAAIWLIQLYRHTVSPLRPPSCRFTPTCSQYAVDALTEFGLLQGGWRAVVRLLKCGPWHSGGWDPIPDRKPGNMNHHGEVAEEGCGSIERRSSTVEQGESQTRV
ncbi:MAG: membrane protein insertion efficiency factor YidD [Actinomycetia bacterium]|nr:membrane protein insertion efficiency factor YidD [Actinomycetes bacterium]MCH9702421.1 membrane protein insertion efficiency factor YidD [Actinomycetes bacterium]MCH9761227.1 membrane protein insertion efficiency factor YidD [Actinomycetes bacterium]